MDSNSINGTPLVSQPESVLPRLCIKCKHYNFRGAAELFGSVELQTAGGLKAYGEWQQQEKQHANREAQLLASGEPFTYEPHHYAWCAAFTYLHLVAQANAGDRDSLEELVKLGAAVIHPVTGEVSPIYALCIVKNANGDCPKYDPR